MELSRFGAPRESSRPVALSKTIGIISKQTSQLPKAAIMAGVVELSYPQKGLNRKNDHCQLLLDGKLFKMYALRALSIGFKLNGMLDCLSIGTEFFLLKCSCHYRCSVALILTQGFHQ